VPYTAAPDRTRIAYPENLMPTDTNDGATAPSITAPTLRRISHLLARHLEATPDNDLYWISVIGEDGMDPQPALVWDQDLRDSLLHVSVTNGWSEGTLLYVYAQRDRYKPEQLRALFRIKVLCGYLQAFNTARQVWTYFESANQSAASRRRTSQQGTGNCE
jgi:hypothetical protein